MFHYQTTFSAHLSFNRRIHRCPRITLKRSCILSRSLIDFIRRHNQRNLTIPRMLLLTYVYNRNTRICQTALLDSLRKFICAYIVNTNKRPLAAALTFSITYIIRFLRKLTIVIRSTLDLIRFKGNITCSTHLLIFSHYNTIITIFL